IMRRITISFLLLSSFFYAQDSNRYTDSLFNINQSVTNGIYATAPEINSPYQGESLTHSAELKFHLFTPVNDTLKNRPMLICIHGGGFVSGNKEHDDMMEFSKIFAQRGYVTATIQYRLGMNLFSSVSAERAVYRGLQDGRAAIRYFKENSETYGIDTNNIYLIGSSAGAFIGLQNIFMNEESERPASSYLISHFPPTLEDGPDLGSLDAINSTLKYGSQPNGVISLWGAIQDTTIIKDSDGDIPLLLIHGTADNIVPFDVGSPFSAASLPPTYGSKPISERLNTLSKNAETYFVTGEGHEFYGVSNGNWNPAPNVYWDTVVTKSTNFLWNIHKPEAKFGYDYIETGDKISFNDSSKGAVKWMWDFDDGTVSYEQNPIHQFPQWRAYLVKLLVWNSIESWDTTSSTVYTFEVGVDDPQDLPINFELKQNFPNPFNPSTKIQYSIPAIITSLPVGVRGGFVTLKIYDILGQEVATLINKNQTAGRYEVEFNAEQLTSGVYIYQLVSGHFVSSKKLLIMK
ncbi:MAG: carboxylesterase family protein, partial [Bacteroidetes bacterium]|nr:carboxylesterase family protein [Bacteroidota bacterium]